MSAHPAVGLIGCGEMGAAIGARLVAAGFPVFTVLEGRGAETCTRAAEAGIAAAIDLPALVARSAILISVLPPALATHRAAEVASIAISSGRELVFLEANAISPVLVHDIAGLFDGTKVDFLDGGIVGQPPDADRRPRLYLSGQQRDALAPMDGVAFDIVDLGPDIGPASAFKMAYAALTKGTNALLTAGLLLAARHGMLDAFAEELSASQPEMMKRAEANVARLPADAGRWVFEMDEIARSFSDAGLPGGFHQGAAEIMRLLDASRFGTETRRTLDRTRTMHDTIRSIDADRRR